MDVNEILDLCLYIVTSASGLSAEPKEYGAVRLIEVLSRLAEDGGNRLSDPYLTQLATETREKAMLVMSDKAEFESYLQTLVIELVRELKKRR